MHVLVDTNVALDFLLEREPWFSEQSDPGPLSDGDRPTPRELTGRARVSISIAGHASA
jgi:hypothetical protein